MLSFLFRLPSALCRSLNDIAYTGGPPSEAVTHYHATFCPKNVTGRNLCGNYRSSPCGIGVKRPALQITICRGKTKHTHNSLPQVSPKRNRRKSAASGGRRLRFAIGGHQAIFALAAAIMATHSLAISLSASVRFSRGARTPPMSGPPERRRISLIMAYMLPSPEHIL